MIRALGFTGTSPAMFALIITLSGGTALAQESTPATERPPSPSQQSASQSQLASDLFRTLGRVTAVSLAVP